MVLDQTLGDRLREGEPQALEEIIAAYGSPVYRLTARILAGYGQDEYEECSSDTFLEVWRKRAQFDPSRSGLRTWVLMLARYRALDYRRRRARQYNPAGETVTVDAVSTEAASPEPLLLDREKREWIMGALAALPAAEREILYRRYFLDESIAAIAASCGISRGAADNRLWRARRSLKRLLLDDHGNKVVALHG